MKKIVNLNKAGKKALAHSDFNASLVKRLERMQLLSSGTGIHSLMEGIGSLGNISGDYVRFDKYMRGNFARDVRGDWERVGECMSKSMKEIR